MLLFVQFIGPNVYYNAAIKTERKMVMFHFINTRGHIQVYDLNGKFLFSVDNERELREELREYEESAA